MSVVPFPAPEVEPDLEHELEQLREERDLALLQLKIIGALHMLERFHGFDAIKDDKCPACGGRVQVKHTRNAVMLEAM